MEAEAAPSPSPTEPLRTFRRVKPSWLIVVVPSCCRSLFGVRDRAAQGRRGDGRGARRQASSGWWRAYMPCCLPEVELGSISPAHLRFCILSVNTIPSDEQRRRSIRPRRVSFPATTVQARRLKLGQDDRGSDRDLRRERRACPGQAGQERRGLASRAGRSGSDIIDRVNPRLNAVVHRLYDMARAAAARRRSQRARSPACPSC